MIKEIVIVRLLPSELDLLIIRITLVFIFLMPIKHIKLNIVFNQFKTELGNYRENMPKVWHKYIRMHVYKYLMNGIYFHRDSQWKIQYFSARRVPVQNVQRVVHVFANFKTVLMQMLCNLKSLLFLINKRILDLKWIKMYDFQPDDWYVYFQACLVMQQIGQSYLERKILGLMVLGQTTNWAVLSVHLCLGS